MRAHVLVVKVCSDWSFPGLFFVHKLLADVLVVEKGKHVSKIECCTKKIVSVGKQIIIIKVFIQRFDWVKVR